MNKYFTKQQSKCTQCEINDLDKQDRLRSDTVQVSSHRGPALSLVDKVSFFIAPTLLGEGKNSLNDLGFRAMSEKIQLQNQKVEIVPNLLNLVNLPFRSVD